MKGRWFIFFCYILAACMMVLNYCLGNPAQYKWIFGYCIATLIYSGFDAFGTVKSIKDALDKDAERLREKSSFFKWFD